MSRVVCCRYQLTPVDHIVRAGWLGDVDTLEIIFHGVHFTVHFLHIFATRFPQGNKPFPRGGLQMYVSFTKCNAHCTIKPIHRTFTQESSYMNPLPRLQPGAAVEGSKTPSQRGPAARFARPPRTSPGSGDEYFVVVGCACSSRRSV